MCEKKKIFFCKNLLIYILRTAWGILFKFKCGLPRVEANSTVNLVPYGLGITELWMRKNCDFIVLVNILTPLVHALFSWAAWHTTICLDSSCRSPLRTLTFTVGSAWLSPTNSADMPSVLNLSDCSFMITISGLMLTKMLPGSPVSKHSINSSLTYLAFWGVFNKNSHQGHGSLLLMW